MFQVSASLSGTSPIQGSQRPVNGTHPDIMAEINSTVAALALPTTEKQVCTRYTQEQLPHTYAVRSSYSCAEVKAEHRYLNTYV